MLLQETESTHRKLRRTDRPVSSVDTPVTAEAAAGAGGRSHVKFLEGIRDNMLCEMLTTVDHDLADNESISQSFHGD